MSRRTALKSLVLTPLEYSLTEQVRRDLVLGKSLEEWLKYKIVLFSVHGFEQTHNVVDAWIADDKLHFKAKAINITTNVIYKKVVLVNEHGKRVAENDKTICCYNGDCLHLQMSIGVSDALSRVPGTKRDSLTYKHGVMP